MLDSSELRSVVVDGKYRIERMLGRGGMGAVFLATHMGTTRPVALKLIIPRFATDPVFVERFRREARAAGRMRHPNIVDVTDFGFAEVDGNAVAYLVMELLDGCSLEEALSEDPVLPLDWVVDIVDQMCLAIDELHRKGIIHRDLKPSNVWLEPNLRGGVTVKILDFGLAKLRELQTAATVAESPPLRVAAITTLAPAFIAGNPADARLDLVELEPAEATDQGPAIPDEDLTLAGSVVGTPAYMAPEQCGGEPVGPGADIYSLACMVYQMLSGAPPFLGRPGFLLSQHMFTRPMPLDERNPRIPPGVSAVVMWALRKDAEERPATAQLFAGALRAKAESSPALVRRGFMLALERFPVFFKAALALLVPFYVIVTATIIVEALRHAGAVAPETASTAFQALFVAEIATLVPAAVLVRGISLLVIAQILVTPQKRVRVALAFDALRRLLWVSLQGAAVWTAFFVGPVLLAIAGARLAAAAFETGDRATGATLTVAVVVIAGIGFKYLCDTLQLPSVILAEGLGLMAALRRARELARRTVADTRLVVGINVVLASLPWVFAPQLAALRTTFVGAVITILAVSVYRHVLQVVMAVLAGVLYFKQRLANAESVESALDQQYGNEAPASKWQRRLDLSLKSLRASGSHRGHSTGADGSSSGSGHPK